MPYLPREYPSRPLIGVGAIIVDSLGRVVLVKRGRPPAQGEWSIPGGLVRLGEPLEAAVVREAFEETGLHVKPIDLVELVERIFYDGENKVQYHYIIADYVCEILGGSLISGSDAADAVFVDRDELAGYELPPVTARVLLKALDVEQ
jgi:ADP-ribose pyrophosphatase YjhB (NUDIX family)